MYKLTLSFKGRILKVFSVTAEDASIGRDPDCDLRIDNLGLEPVHARVRSEKGELFLHSVSGNAEVLLNGKTLSGDQRLGHGDVLLIGKHTVSVLRDHAASAAEPAHEDPTFHEAWLQFLNGPKLGRTIRLDRSLVRLGKSGGQSAMIASRSDGFYISHLGGEQPTRVGEQVVGEESVQLQDGDTIQIGSTQMLFFTEQR